MQRKYDSLNPMAGTTIVAGLIDLLTERLQIVHLGDSRAYLFRGGKLQMLTRDHDQIAEYLAAVNKKAPGTWSQTFRQFKALSGPADPVETYLKLKSRFSPLLSALVHDLSLEYDRSQGKHRMTEALGFINEPAFSHLTLKLQKDDWVIICSDGVHKSCHFRPLEETIAANSAKSPYQLSTAITRMLDRELGIRDDITIGAYRHA
jgi:serine/threonine protein phosphatase PrpC